MSAAGEAMVLNPGEGRLIPSPDAGGAVTIKVSSNATGGTITVYESSRAIGDTGGPAAHSHPGFDEMCYVVAGEYVFTIGGRDVDARAGTFVFLPRGVFHGFRSTGKEAGKLLAMCLPGGIEDLFEELTAQAADLVT